MKLIRHYFPELSALQLEQLETLPSLYSKWNEKINVISRRDIENLEERHILHSLSIARFIQFNRDSNILDLGTGGGFPGIPLAIYFPQVNFDLVDSRGKKIIVVNNILNQLSLQNAKAIHSRAENMAQAYDFIVTRAVANLDQLVTWCAEKIKTKNKHNISNGLIALKGGNIQKEVAEIRNYRTDIFPISRLFSEEFFKEKYIVYTELQRI